MASPYLYVHSKYLNATQSVKAIKEILVRYIGKQKFNFCPVPIYEICLFLKTQIAIPTSKSEVNMPMDTCQSMI